MCNVLIIEDQSDTIERYKDLASNSGLTFLSPAEVGLTENITAEKGVSVEEQLAKFLKIAIRERGIDVVLLDTDLSRQRELQTHSSYKSALRDLGMPVCRYQKGGRDSALSMLPQLQRSIRDGASAIWIPRSLVSGDRGEELVPRLKAISAAFGRIEAVLAGRPELVEKQHSPTDVLAAVLGDDNLAYEFLGYAAQNLVYFAAPEPDSMEYEISKVKRYATQLGYWLFNYILMFPGPILSRPAAAAYLNVSPLMFDSNPAFASLIEHARYVGPFDGVESYYWRSKLSELADSVGGDIAMHPGLSGVTLDRIDRRNEAVQAYICMLSGEAITADQAAPSPDWVPSGASEAKIKEEVLDELGPLAGI
ncbi:hypothetical protein [Achromobacter sp. NFACC18-2]|uniref:hypothetical protein n=1 Tax=Achromobacter sp. NFACC18-2 TaxID=1564112 RepID=UPI001113B08C|nr:hypothetical protein [Achromobacter sp. NFACC18-2]